MRGRVEIFLCDLCPPMYFNVFDCCVLREEHRLEVFERRVCGPKRDEVTGEWRKIHN
jgi:hypothetical protein